jgi:uncharacterized cupredoxin-like copper-binding protein
MTTLTEHREDQGTHDLEAELEELRHELEERKRRNSGLWLAALFALLLASAALIAVALGSNDSQNAATSMHNQMSGSAGGMMGAGSAGSGAATATSKPAAGPAHVVTSQLGDYWVRPNVTSVPAGNVTFKATNVGKVEHELMVERMPIKMDGPGQPNEEAAQGMIEDMEPGESGQMTLNLKPGMYMLFCNVPGHYALGQHTMLKVTG